MKRTPLLLFAILASTFSFSQIKVTNAVFQGKNYRVYPARLPFDYLSSDSYRSYSYYKNGAYQYKFKESLMPYNPFQLEDGDYIVYYEKKVTKRDKKTREPIYSHDDTTIAAVTFSLVNGQKSGNATWYNYTKHREVLQTGQYKNGVKHGFWTINRQKGTWTYSYVNGVKNGQQTKYNDKKEITEIVSYEDGFKKGWQTEYYDYDKQKIQSRSYFDGIHGATKEMYYNDKGQLTYMQSDSFADNIKTKRYDKGVLISTYSNTDSLGYHTTRIYYSNGRLAHEYVYIETSYYNVSYADMRNGITKKLPKPDWWKYRNISEALNGRQYCVSEKAWDEGGHLVSSFDVRTIIPGDTVFNYNAKGVLLKKLWLDPQHESFLHCVQYLKKYTNYKTYNLSSKQIAITRINQKGDTVYLKNSPYYLSELNKDKSGFVLCLKDIEDKKMRYQYNLLHTTTTLATQAYKGNKLSDVQFRYTTGDTVKRVVATWIEYDKKHRLSVQHPHIYDIVTYENSEVLKSYQYKNDIEKIQTLNELYDTLEYRYYHMGIPFTGEIKFKKKYTSYKKRDRVRYKMKYDIQKIKTKYRTYYDTTLVVKSHVRNFDYPSIYNETNVSDGYVGCIKKNYTKEACYDNNLKQGEGNDEDKYEGFYVNGEKHGMYQNTKQFEEYFQGMRHGLTMKLGYYGSSKRYSKQVDYKANFTLDTLNGLFQSFNNPGVVGQSVLFDKGYPNGKYFRGNLTCPVSVDVTLDHGYLVDTAFYYFNEGTIKAKVYHTKEDSAFYRYTNKPVTGSWGIKSVRRFLETDKMIDFSATRTGNYQYFYKNGVMASEGRIEHRSKLGTWKYYDLSGQLYKQVEYDSGWYNIPGTNDSIRYYGKLRMWQPNGKELLYGLIRSNSSRFKCDQEMAVNYETLYYLSMYDRDGKPVVVNGTGPVEEYHNNSEISIKGQLLNGKRYGLWKFYNPNGRLEEMGNYDEQGRKTGTWVSGDLEAVPYVENLCSPGATHATIFPDANKTGMLTSTIKLKEEVYEKGISLESSSTQLIPLY